jgi:mannose/fructose/N-acetylgalactosamine-specific phosphotransferase system component IIC
MDWILVLVLYGLGCAVAVGAALALLAVLGRVAAGVWTNRADRRARRGR